MPKSRSTVSPVQNDCDSTQEPANSVSPGARVTEHVADTPSVLESKLVQTEAPVSGGGAGLGGGGLATGVDTTSYADVPLHAPFSKQNSLTYTDKLFRPGLEYSR